MWAIFLTAPICVYCISKGFGLSVVWPGVLFATLMSIVQAISYYRRSITILISSVITVIYRRK